MKRIESLHNRIVRTIIKDYNKVIPTTKLREIEKRATPKEWSNYAHARLLYQLLVTQEPIELFLEIAPYIYFERRFPFRPKVVLESTKRNNHNVLLNRLHYIAKSIKFDWFDNNTTLSSFKTKAKNQFFSYLARAKRN